MAKIGIHLKTYEDELISSWILRYSKKMKTKYHTFIANLLPGSYLDTRDIDLNIKEEHLKTLASITFHSYESLANMTLKSYYPNLTTNVNLSNWVLTQGVYHRTIRNNHLNYCPTCLAFEEEPYFRKRWRLINSVVCTRCGYNLNDHCPKCLSPIDFRRLDIGYKEKILEKSLCYCSNCNFDLRETNTSQSDSYLLDKQIQTDYYIQKGYTESLQYSHLYFDVFYLLMSTLNSTRKRMVQFDQYVSKYFDVPQQHLHIKKKVELKNTELVNRQTLLIKVYKLMDMPSYDFLELCKAGGMIGCFLQFEKKETPFWFSKIVKEGLSIKFTEWKTQYPKYSRTISSYKKLGKRLIN